MFVSSFLYIPNGNLEGVITTIRAGIQILWYPFHLEFCECYLGLEKEKNSVCLIRPN